MKPTYCPTTTRTTPVRPAAARPKNTANTTMSSMLVAANITAA